MSLKKCLLSSRIVPQIKGSSVLNNHINRPCRAMSSNRVHGQGYSCACMLCTNINQYAQGLSKTSPKIDYQSASFHASRNDLSPLLSNQNGLLLPRSATSSEAMTSKRTFTFSKADDDDAHHIDDLLENNKAWVSMMKRDRPNEFKKLAENQTPKYLYFGCSDSRVPANKIMGLGPGEVFVHRNVGNLVPGNDLNALSVLEFAVEHLGVTDIIVTGHYNCGACKAAVTRQDLGMLENWLRLIRDVYRLHREYLDSIPNEEERHKKLVELNVVEQCVNIYKTGVVQRKRLKNRAEHASNKDLANAPRIHGLVFDTANGTLSRLNVDYSRVGSLESIYALY